MAQLSSRELLYLEDSIKTQDFITKHSQKLAVEFADPQLKSLCETLSREHSEFQKTLARHLGGRTLQ